MIQGIANNIGFSIGLCLLHWPIGFSAAKGSLRLKYRWQPFLVGYVLSVAGLFSLITVWGAAIGSDPTSGAMGWVELMFLLPIPLGVAVAVTFLLRSRFVEDRVAGERSNTNASPPPTRILSSAVLVPRGIKDPLVWCAFLTVGAIILSISFPAWELPNEPHRRLGRGSILGPTRSSLEAVEFQCTNVRYDAERKFARLKASLSVDEDRWHQTERDWQTMAREREEAIRRIRAEGRDPNRVSSDGQDLLYDRNGLPSGPAATAVPYFALHEGDREPHLILADAGTQLANAREACRRAVDDDQSVARIDFVTLAYETIVVAIMGALLCCSACLIRRRSQ